MEDSQLITFKRKHLKKLICYDLKKATYDSGIELLDGIALTFSSLFILTNQSFIPNTLWTWLILISLATIIFVVRQFRSFNYCLFGILFFLHLPWIEVDFYRQQFEWFPETASLVNRIGRFVIMVRLIWGVVGGFIVFLFTPFLVYFEQQKIVDQLMGGGVLMSESCELKSRFSQISIYDLRSNQTEEELAQTYQLFEGTFVNPSGVDWLIEVFKNFPLSEMELLEIDNLAQFLDYFSPDDWIKNFRQ